MFKKPFKAQQQNLLKSSDKRKLRDNLLRNFPDIKEDDLNIVIPPKEDVMMQKVAGTHFLIYMVGNNPVFFDLDGRGDYFPTVYTLWKIPHIVPSLTIHPPVAKYVLSGADLMLPGVIVPDNGVDGFGELFVGDKRSIMLKGISMPIAVGTMATSTKDIKKNGMKGRAIKVLHYVRDQLWAHGKKEIPEILINGPAEGGEDLSEEGADAPMSETTQQLSQLELEAKDGDVSMSDAPTTEQNEPINTTTSEPAATTTTTSTAPSGPDDMDKLLEACLLGGLRNTKDKDLPALVSTFYSSKMLPSRPPGTNVDIKKSSFKKISNFLAEYSTRGLIELREYSGALNITGIARTHQLYKEFRVGTTVASEEALAKPKEGLPEGITITELYGIPSDVAILFNNATKDQVFTHDEVSEGLWAYVKEKCTAGPSDAEGSAKAKKSVNVTLDPVLTKFLKRQQADIPKQELLTLFKSKLKPYYAITHYGETNIKKGQVRNIQVQVEKRQGRYVTSIMYLEALGLNLDDLAKECQHMFATSTTVQPMLEKTAGHMVVIQGNVMKDVSKHLITKYTIPKKYIEEHDKVKNAYNMEDLEEAMKQIELKPAHPSGSARTEGYYKLDRKSKARNQRMSLAGIPASPQKQRPEVTPTTPLCPPSARSTRAKLRQLSLAVSNKESVEKDFQYFQIMSRKKRLKFQKSTIHEWGLFALEPIAARDMVIEYVGEIIRQKVAEERERLYEKNGIGSSYFFRVDRDTIIDATKKGNLARFINHCCDPNCSAKIISFGDAKKIIFYSKRKIAVGEEITCDYKFPYEETKIPCLCRSAKCRGTLN